MIPQFIYLSLVLVGLGIEICQHGKPKTGNNNAISYIIGSAIILAILYWGGFFKPII